MPTMRIVFLLSVLAVGCANYKETKYPDGRVEKKFCLVCPPEESQ